MTPVSNASPLINLARIGELALLHQLYGEVIIPEAVWHEVVVQGKGQPGAVEVEQASWIHKQQIANQPLAQALQQELDAGEAEAIVLALERQVAVLLMDERLGRDTAQHMGLRCIGLIGVLIAAKQRGLIVGIKPLLDTLRNIAGFRVDEALYQRVLKDEGEA